MVVKRKRKRYIVVKGDTDAKPFSDEAYFIVKTTNLKQKEVLEKLNTNKTINRTIVTTGSIKKAKKIIEEMKKMEEKENGTKHGL
jgi:hypothetical protein